jgi:predicted ATPase
LPQISQGAAGAALLAQAAASVTARYLTPDWPTLPMTKPEGEIGGAGKSGAARAATPAPEQRLYRFTELPVQEALGSLIPRRDQQAIHWRIGCRLLESMPAGEREKQAPALLDHLNRGRTLIKTRDERMNLAELNLIAGQEALAVVAPAPAYDYFGIGLALLRDLPGEDPWASAYNLTKELCLGAAQAAYRNANFEAAQRLTTEARQHATSLLDQVACDHIRMHALDWENRPKDGIAFGMRALRRLGVRLPRQPSRLDTRPGGWRARGWPSRASR